jgi:hypothetical protein
MLLNLIITGEAGSIVRVDFFCNLARLVTKE